MLEETSRKNVLIADGAKELGKSQQYLRLALQDGRVPFRNGYKEKRKKEV